jgi:hypothetical protein
MRKAITITGNIEWTKIKNSRAIFIVLLAISLFSPSAKAIDRHSNADNEKEIARQWLEKNQKVPAESSLMKALLSLHYQPSSTLLPFHHDKLENSKKRIVLSLMIFQCTDNSQFSYCDGASLEDELVRLNPKNLFPYLLLFNHYVEKGDVNKALTSLKKGLSATEVNDYYFDKVMYLRNELASIGVRGKRANVLAEEFSGKGLDKIYINIMPTCAEHTKTSTEWKSVCLELSDRLEKGTTFLANVVGAALRRDVLKAASADETKFNEALARRKFYNTFRESARAKHPTWDDPAQKPDSYYNNAVEFGELRAIQIMIDDVSAAPSE